MLLRFLLVAGVSTWSVFHSVPVGAAEKSKSHPQRLANRPAGNAGKNFYIGLDYNPTFNGVKNLKIIEEVEGARGLFPLSKNASDTSEFNSYHFDWSTPMCGIEFGNSTLAFGGSLGYRTGRARIEVGIGHERFVIKGGDDTAFLLGKGLALDTARGQLLSSALGRMSMSDVHRLKREVVDSEGIASPVRAMFSRQIPDGDTLLAGEMAGVDDGLVIQELSRPEELEKLQHELAKQVSKLAELGELKWLERLEAIETEELVVRVQELKRKAASIREKLRELEEKNGQLEVKLKEELEKLGIKNVEKANAEGLKKLKKQEEEKIKALEWLGEKLEEIGKLQSAEEMIQKLRELSILGLLEEKKLKEVKDKVKGTELENHLDKTWVLRRMGEAGKELAAIRELKALGLEEQLRTLAEVKEVKALVESKKDRGLEIQEGLTERIRGLERRLVWSEAQKLEEIQELTQRQRIRPENEPQAVKKAAGMLEMIRVLRKLGQLDELIPEEQLRTLAEVKEMLGLESMQKLGELTEVKALKALERSSEWEKLKEKKLALVAKLKNRGAFWVGAEEKNTREAGKRDQGTRGTYRDS